MTEAVALTALIGPALSVGGFARSRLLLERCARRRGMQSTSPAGLRADTLVEPSSVAWAVSAVARRLPFWNTCLVQALVTDVMLRRRGVPSSIHVGVRRGETLAPIVAHAWVESGGAVVIGGLDDLGDFTVLSGARLL